MPEALLTSLHFVRPWWLLAVLPALLLALLWARHRVGGSHWEDSIAPELLAVLLEPRGRGGNRRLPWFVAVALTASAIALAGPSWERLPQPVEQRSDALVILFDLSLSMFAEDVAPSRLVRARQKIADVLRRREEGFTAMVAYAGDAHAVVPLTDDVRTIENLLPSLRPDMMPVLGSNLGAAVELAHSLFENAGIGQGRILVVTDAVDEMHDATERRDPSFPLSILGVGTEPGGTIPLDFVNQPGQVLRTQQGDPIVARLDEDRLRSIVDITHGRYHSLTLGDQDLDYLLATPLPGDDATTAVEREFDTWADMGYWICLPLIPLLLGAFRRGVLALLPMVLAPLALTGLLLPAPARAGVWDDLWQRRDQQAHQALKEGQPELATALFEDPAWRAAALYRSGEYGPAADAFSRQQSLTAQYNMGNALARQGDYQRALTAYEAVLAADPDHQDARFNKALIEKLLDQQQSADDNEQARQQPGADQPEDSSQPQGDSDSEPGAGQQDAEGQPPDEAPPPEEGGDAQPDDSQQDEQEQEALSSRDEKQDALEQWLRRVPDDPGGLLRRKFQYETNQRLRRGDYSARETEKIW